MPESSPITTQHLELPLLALTRSRHLSGWLTLYLSADCTWINSPASRRRRKTCQ